MSQFIEVTSLPSLSSTRHYHFQGAGMTGKSITRSDLTGAVYKSIGSSRAEAADLVEQVIEQICSTLAAGETVKLTGFGVFTVRNKAARVGRNPKTGAAAPIKPRKSITFRPSPVLGEQVNEGTRKPRPA